MAQVRVREIVGTMRVMDGESLLTGPMLERIVGAVMEAMAASREDDERRRRDTRIGGACCSSCEEGHR
ncbi:MAG TPA: hypothetical protein VFZ36_07470 [Vicinamibacterales bacterium]